MSAPPTMIAPFSADTPSSNGKHRNDNSNPQQGTGGIRPSDAPLSPTTVAPTPYIRPTIKIPPTKKDERKLFVGGLPANVTGEEFRAFFEQFGPVLDSIVLVDRNTNRSRGFGFVTFQSPEPARKLLSMGDDADPKVGRLEMMGKMIEVKSAEPKESARRFPPNRRPQAVPSMSYPAAPSVDPNAFPNAPPEGGVAYPPPPFYPFPGVMFAGHAAPMYYRMPLEGQPMQDVAPPQQPFVAMEGYVPAFSFFPSHPYGVPPQQISQPYYPGAYSEGVNENNNSSAY